jgi:hypothetical protein
MGGCRRDVTPSRGWRHTSPYRDLRSNSGIFDCNMVAYRDAGKEMALSKSCAINCTFAEANHIDAAGVSLFGRRCWPIPGTPIRR